MHSSIGGAWATLEEFASPVDSVAWASLKVAELARASVLVPAVRAFAVSAVRACPPIDDECEARALLGGLRRAARYTRDPVAIDLVQAPEFTLAAGGGDCASLSALYAAAARAIGLRVALLFGTARPGYTIATHVLVAVALRGRWVPVEVSVPLELGAMPRGFRVLEFVEV